MLKPWWETWPNRLEYELKALEAAGITIEDQQRDGYRLILTLRAQVDGTDVRLIARFPDLYPFTRFEVFAPDLSLNRHQNPHLKNLCLVPLGDYWEISDTLASYLSKQLPRVFTAATSEDPNEVAELEVHQGEPVSHYYACLPNAIILLNSEWGLGKALSGELLIRGYFDATGFVRATVTEVGSDDGTVLFRQQPLLISPSEDAIRSMDRDRKEYRPLHPR